MARPLRAVEVADAQLSLPGFGAVLGCVHPVGRLAYLGMSWQLVVCRDCGCVLDVPALPLSVRRALDR